MIQGKIGRATKKNWTSHSYFWRPESGPALYAPPRPCNVQGALIRTGQKTFFCKSGQARKFWRALIGRAIQKQNKKDKTGQATQIFGAS